MNLINFFTTLEKKMDEGEEILRFTQVDSKEYSTLIENLGTTLGILRNAEDLYKHFSQFENNENGDSISNDEDFNLIKGTEYSSIYGLDAKEIDIVAFVSDNCSWCQKLKPILQKLEESGRKVEFVDVDIHSEHAEKYQVTGFPTTFLVEDGMIKEVAVGYYEDLIERFYKN